MVILSSGLIFVHINRTGGCSIERAIEPIGDEPLVRHETAIVIRKRVGKSRFDQCHKFTVVRNPWDRMVSMYCHRCQNIRDRRYRSIKFGDFLRNLDKMGHKKIFTANQLDWISDRNGRLLVDEVGRFEELSSFWDGLCSSLSLDLQRLERINHSKHKRYDEYYNKRTKEIVAKRFARDIKYFGYKFV